MIPANAARIATGAGALFRHRGLIWYLYRTYLMTIISRPMQEAVDGMPPAG